MNGTHNVLATQLSVAMIVTMVIEWVKGQHWFPWLTMETAKLNRVVSAIIAAGAAVGISVTWNPADHVLTIGNLTLVGIVTMAWVAIKQFVFQEFVYKSAIKK